MNIHKLEIFVSLARTLNFTKTAQELYLSQTTVSQQIRSLEEELDVELFSRNSRSVRLTDAGRTLEARAGSFVRQYREMLDAVAPFARKQRALSIEYTGPIEQDMLRRVITRYRFSFPHSPVAVRYASQTVAKYDLFSGACDIVFSVGQEFASEEVISMPVCRNPVRVAVSAGSRLSQYPELTLEDLRDKKIILLTQDSAEKGNRHVRRMLAGMGFRPEQVEEANSIEAQLFLIEMDMGVSFLPASRALGAERIAFVPFRGMNNMHEILMFYRSETPQIAGFTEAVKLEIESDGGIH